MDQVFHELLLFVHCLEASERFRSNVGTGHFHGYSVVGLLHLRHVDQLTEKILVHVQHFRGLPADAVLDLLMVQEEHLVNVARLVLIAATIIRIVSLTLDHLG